MAAVSAVLVDFDGTASSGDVAELLPRSYAVPSWSDFADAVDRGEIGLREAIQIQDAMLLATGAEMIALAVEHCPLDPTFAPFVDWLSVKGVEVALVSDGFGFYIRPILEAAG